MFPNFNIHPHLLGNQAENMVPDACRMLVPDDPGIALIPIVITYNNTKGGGGGV
jgi:hypothetical protein